MIMASLILAPKLKGKERIQNIQQITFIKKIAADRLSAAIFFLFKTIKLCSKGSMLD
jgi:putative heme iron utilization protein